MRIFLDHVGRTKILPPQPRVSLIFRERLLEKLSAASTAGPARAAALTLLSAPAGSGKTTLLVSLQAAQPEASFLWLALDENDNDPAQFFTLLLAAFEARQPGSTAKTQALLDGLEQFDFLLLLNALINDVIDHFPDPFTVILDDVHFLTNPALLKGLDYLLERAPTQMRFLMAGRYPPALSLARLRARLQLVEVRLEELSFSQDEMQEYFQETLRLPLTPETIRQIHQLTQGWAAGVALFGSSMEQSRAEDVEQSFTPLLAQTNRHVFDFLTEEIINQEKPETRAFLLKTSVLAELSPKSCAALAGVSRESAGALLEDLYRRNIFLAQVGQETYRFHDLFAAYLSERLAKEMPGQVKELYRRAAEEETNLRRRIALLARAEDWDAAMGSIEAAGDTLLAQGSYALLENLIQMVPEAQRMQRASLLYYQGICANQAFDLSRARDLLQQAAAHLAQEGDQDRLGTALLSLATCLSSTGDFAGARDAMEQALTCPLQPHQAAHLRIARAWQRIAQADWQGANSDLDALLDLLEQETTPNALRVIAPQWHYLFGALPGGARRVERYARCCQVYTGDDLLRAAALAQTAWVRVWQGDWAQAREDATEAERISQKYGGLLWIDTDAGVLLPLLAAREGALNAVEAGFERLFLALEQPQAAALAETWMPVYLFSLGHSWWLNDRLDEARAALRRMQAARATQWQAPSMLPAFLEALLNISDEKYAEAEVVLLECLKIQEQYQFTRCIENAALALAYLYWRQDQLDRAMEYLVPELERCEQEALPGFLLWSGKNVMLPLLRLAVSRDSKHAAFSRRVLGQLLASEAGVLVPETGERLTAREEEVLRLISAGASNAEIARQLVISIHTVKIHVAHLLAKLNVDSRQAAAARARELGIG